MTKIQRQAGAAMIELLVAMLVIAFGMLGFVGLQSQTALSQVESYQRSQAVLLVNDIAERMSLNRPGAASYIGTDFGLTTPTYCALLVLTQAQKDLCEWIDLLQGASEKQGTNKLGAMLGARACISTDPSDTSPNAYLITVVWQGVQPTGAPTSTCGANEYSAENLRRAVNKVLRFATLT